jgi:2-polyprenyl-6-methoxyphenol hydroxylase-like FAD-dependent oxidoreductase
VTQRHAEVVGAGLGGLTVATALAHRGWSVRVHEEARELRMFGAGIWLWENGLRALDQIGALEQTIARTGRITAWERRDEKHRLLLRAEFNDRDRLYIPPRADLYDSLLTVADKAGVEIATSSPIISATPEGEIERSDGTRFKGDLVIGADGHRSAVRESLGLTRRFRLKKEGCTRLLIARRPDERSSVSIEWWSGHRRLLVCPASNETIYVCLALRIDDERGCAIPVDKRSWLDSFPHLEDVIARIGTEARWDVLSEVVCTNWSKGRTAVVGDAAHAQPPNLGQGANLAFANSITLAASLDQAPTVERGLAMWEARERPVTDHTQRWSNLYGGVCEHWPGWLSDVRSLVVWATGRSRWLEARLSRAARHVPELTDPQAAATAIEPGR